MAANKTRFLSDEEKLEFYSGISGYDLKDYDHSFEIKMYEGAEVLLYHYSKLGELIFDTVLMCSDFTVTDKGIRASMIDRKNFKIAKVGEVPNRLGMYDILTHTPYRCIVERTLKRTTFNGKMMQGVTSSLCFRSKSEPSKKIPCHTQAIALIKAPHSFPKVQYELAVARLEASYCETC